MSVSLTPKVSLLQTPVAPQFYGGPIELPDGSLLGTVGVYWKKANPLSPGPDGGAIRELRKSWRIAQILANQKAGGS